MKVALLCLAFISVDAANYKMYKSKTCYTDHGAHDIDNDSSAPTGHSVDTCEERCDFDAQCDCVTFRPSDGKCWKRSACVPQQFGSDSSYATYVKASGYVQYTHKTCYNGHGGTEIDSEATAQAGKSPASCQAICDADTSCDCVSFRLSDGKCWRRSSCTPSEFGSDDNFNTYVKKNTPTPPTPTPTPPPPSPSPTPTPGRLGSFIAIGDWGHDDNSHGNCYTSMCQKTVAQTMHDTMAELGDVKFIINVGDSFYPNGVSSKDDWQWDAKWRNVYSQELRSVPWYSVYGNHDYHQDPGACSDNVADGAQINGDIDDLNTFYMPGYNWYKEHPELELEVVAMDLNNYQNGWNHGVKASDQSFADCQYSKCKSDCYGRIKGRAEEGFKLFKERAAATSAKNLLVFSHYPTDYFWDTKSADSSSDFLAHLSDASKFHVEFFGGHRHNVDQNTVASISPNSAWLSGGGGGWSCDGSEQGFVVGEIASDGTMTTRAVLVDQGLCCSRFLGMNASEPKNVLV